ncbi:acyl-CoA thioesterase [Porticoccaceae bacterium]|nr:acyl-CoA thioesterase [Porticoccaceae bacterium]
MHLLYKGIVHPWHCDVMGHMNTRHYLGMFDDASYQLIQESTGWSVGDKSWQGRGFADVHNSLDYLGELKAGDLLEISGGISAIGNSSFTASYFMTHKLTGAPAAKMTAKLIYFDLVARKSVPLTDKIRQQMESRKIDVD